MPRQPCPATAAHRRVHLQPPVAEPHSSKATRTPHVSATLQGVVRGRQPSSVFMAFTHALRGNNCTQLKLTVQSLDCMNAASMKAASMKQPA